MQSNRSVDEAKSHIRQAINSVDKVKKSQMRKKQTSETQFQTWWGHIQSGTDNVAASPMSAEAHTKSLDLINNMISVEDNKLQEL